MDKVTNALKRLERAGSVTSASRGKLWLAAVEIAQKVVDTVACPAPLPRGWRIDDEDGMNGFGLVLAHGTEFIQGPRPHHLKPETLKELMTQHRLALQLAEDIASGWIDELTEMLKSWEEDISSSAEVILSASSVVVSAENHSLVSDLLTKSICARDRIFNRYIMSEDGGGWSELNHQETIISGKSATVHVKMSAETRTGHGDFDLFILFCLMGAEWVSQSIRVEGTLPEYNQTYVEVVN